MIYRPSETLTLLIYEDQRPAKCFEIKKGQVKFLSLVIPLIVLSSVLSVLFIFAYIKNLSTRKTLNGPSFATLQLLQEENGRLVATQKELKELNNTLMGKIQGTADTTNLMPLFRPTMGYEDLTGESPLALRNLKTQVMEKSLSLTFDIVNIHPEQNKVSGFVFAMMKDSDQLTFFPSLKMDLKEAYLTSFDQGESFTVTRFRPVEASFPKPSKSPNQISFKIFIFSKTGDLLFQKSIGPVDL